MRHRSRAVAVFLVVVLYATFFANSAGGQTTTQERSSSSQQQMQAKPAQTTVKQVKPVKPVSPMKADLTIDSRAGDIAAAGATELMVIDLKGDGLDLGGRTKIRVGGAECDTNWTRPGTADGFLVVDAAVLREMGFEIDDSAGRPVQNRILMSDGLLLRTPDGTSRMMVDAWYLLGSFDSNRDGKLDSNDRAWPGMSLFVDANSDGTMGDGELFSLANSAVREFSLKKSSARTDVHGNTVTDGSFVRTDGVTGALVAVKLRRY